MRLGVHQAGKDRIAARLARGAALLCGILLAIPAAAQVDGAGSTRPGTVIANTADLRWMAGGQAESGRSNTDRLIVAERLDIRLAAAAADGGTGALPFIVTNAGNGDEAFLIAVAAAGDPARGLVVVVDADGEGRCDPAADRTLADGRTPSLAAGESVRLLVCDADGAVRVTARAATGSGAPGTVFTGAGDGGGDAIVGNTGAAATLLLDGPDGGGPAGAAPTLVKSQSVLATDGSARAAAGSVITYTLVARFPAATAAAAIEDALPAGTSLVPDSLELDGAALSDAADADAGDVAAGIVRVRLGDVPAGAEHRVTFAVTVNP